MNKKILMGIAVSLCFVPLGLQAQQDDSDGVYIYATYFGCSPDGESRADEIINTSFKPHYDAAVEQGDIIGWTWMQHFVGGSWRRALVIVARDMGSLLDASGALGEIISESTPEAGRAFSGICGQHEDYIWQPVSGVGGVSVTESRGDAGFSVYMKCDMSKEERADELVRDVLGPIYDKHLGDDGFTSWNWLMHNVGGEYRRLLIMGAADHKTLMRTRAAILEELTGRRLERALREFNAICHTHQDYMWDILVQTP